MDSRKEGSMVGVSIVANSRSRQVLFGAFFFTVLLFLLYQFYVVFSFFLVPLAWSAVLALVFFPVYELTFRLLGGRENLVALVVTTGVILGVIMPTIIFSVLLTRESVAFVQELRGAYESGDIERWVALLRASLPGQWWDRIAPLLREWKIDPASVGLRTSDTVSTFLVGQVKQLATNALHFVGNFFLIAFTLFFCFRDGKRMVRSFRDLVPMAPRHKDVILTRLYEALSAVIQGTLLTAALQGVLAGIGLWITGVPFAVLLGGATAMMSMIPFVGPVAWVGGVVYLAVSEAYVRALLLFLWGSLIVGSVDNVLRPMIIGGRTQLPTVFLFFGILGGLQAYGFLGIFVGPVLLAILVAFLRIYREEYSGGAQEVADATMPAATNSAGEV